MVLSGFVRARDVQFVRTRTGREFIQLIRVRLGSFGFVRGRSDSFGFVRIRSGSLGFVRIRSNSFRFFRVRFDVPKADGKDETQR